MNIVLQSHTKKYYLSRIKMYFSLIFHCQLLVLLKGNTIVYCWNKCATATFTTRNSNFLFSLQEPVCVLPPIDSKSQTTIRRRIVLDKLFRT